MSFRSPNLESNPTGGLRTEVVQHLYAARLEKEPGVARRLLIESVRLADQLIKLTSEGEAKALRADALTELALLEPTINKREAYWRKALQTFRGSLDPVGAEAFASAAVDFTQDDLLGLLDVERLQVLNGVLKTVNSTLKEMPSADQAMLLARKSSVLRQLAQFQSDKPAKLAMVQGAMRCANAASMHNKTPGVTMELGACEWSAAQFSRSDKDHAVHIRQCIEHFNNVELENFPPAQLAIASVYRFISKPLQACLSYPQSLPRDLHLRKVLRQSYIQAEAATHLWYRQYPEEIARPQLERAAILLESAIAAGYKTARIVCDLAFVRAALGDTVSAETVLSDLVVGEGMNWTGIVKALENHESTDPLMESFTIGITQSAVLTRLGTFAWRFTKDLRLAESLYRAAIKVRSTDAVALTNLARFLIENKRGIDEARRLLSRVEAVASTGFTWWRQLQTALQSESPRSRGLAKAPIYDPRTFAHLRSEFRRLKTSGEPQERGFALERLIKRLAELTFGHALSAYRFERAPGDVSQIDGYFPHKGDRYRVECKWEKTQTERPSIVQFHDKLDVAGISGLFISIAGFGESAVAAAREKAALRPILLADGDEIEAVFEGWLNLDTLLTEKRAHFDSHSDTYYRVVRPNPSALD
jgi:hypothetical protein